MRRTGVWASLGLAAAFVSAACGGGDDSAGNNVTGAGGTGSAGASAADCPAQVSLVCEKYATCAPYVLKSQFGDAATCKARLTIACEKDPQPAACGPALAAASCTDFTIGNIPAACAVAGPKADGTKCGSDSECKSTQCFVDAATGCGVCSARQAAGGACKSSSDCQRGLRCSSAMVCSTYKKGGDTCDASTPCEPGLSCTGPAGAKKCGAAAKAGQPCDPTGVAAPTCDLLTESVCNPNTKICATLAYGGPGQPCGAGTATTPPTLCSNGGKCTGGVCVAAVADGGSCGADTGDCLEPAECIGGRCLIADPASCK